MTWPDHFPENCPPEEAIPASGLVYRLLKDDHIQPWDFLSHRERFPNKNFFLPECQVCGLSVYLDIEGVRKMQRRVSSMRGKKLCYGTLTPEMGAMKPTGHEISHRTWWPTKECDRSAPFSLVKAPAEI